MNSNILLSLVVITALERRTFITRLSPYGDTILLVYIVLIVTEIQKSSSNKSQTFAYCTRWAEWVDDGWELELKPESPMLGQKHLAAASPLPTAALQEQEMEPPLKVKETAASGAAMMVSCARWPGSDQWVWVGVQSGLLRVEAGRAQLHMEPRGGSYGPHHLGKLCCTHSLPSPLPQPSPRT